MIELIYTYYVDITQYTIFLIAAIAVFFLAVKKLDGTNKYLSIVFTIAFMFIFVTSTYHEVKIWRALNSDCTVSSCTIVEGKVKHFRSYKGDRKFRVNEFSVNGYQFVLTGGTSNTNGVSGYGRIVEKGGILTPNSKVKMYVYNSKIIKLYKEKM